MAGMFDVPLEKKTSREWHLDFRLDAQPWNVGLIVGPSGSGKSTIARELFGNRLVNGWPWPAGQSVLDGFPAGMSVVDVTGLLSSVGFSSPPSWVKPFDVLSNGEKFRVELARTLAEAADLAVVDEFTSVVDRQVAQIGSAALAKTVRSTGRRFVAVGCHYDVIDWLQPDWVVDLGKTDDQHRVQLEWRSLRRRPEIQLSIRRAGAGEWPRFREHHYLSGKLHRSAKCFVAEVDGQAAAFAAVLWYPHHNSVQGGWYREHRVVCLPDYQGVGIGNRLSELIASIYAATGKSYRSRTSHPSMIRHRTRSRLWRLLAQPAMTAPTSGSTRKSASFNRSIAGTRMTAGFEYVGPARPDDARALGLRL
ncbi:MAG: GNAT family N-acetyltransferase [Planctomycetales bacterium]|nr:GNAT family N-acetyltransferase [Planctomycetales bacterium]